MDYLIQNIQRMNVFAVYYCKVVAPKNVPALLSKGAMKSERCSKNALGNDGKKTVRKRFWNLVLRKTDSFT